MKTPRLIVGTVIIIINVEFLVNEYNIYTKTYSIDKMIIIFVLYYIFDL